MGDTNRGNQQSMGEWSWTQVRKPAKSNQESRKQSRGGGGEPGTAGNASRPPQPNRCRVTQNPSCSDQSITSDSWSEWKHPWESADIDHGKIQQTPAAFTSSCGFEQLPPQLWRVPGATAVNSTGYHPKCCKSQPLRSPSITTLAE